MISASASVKHCQTQSGGLWSLYFYQQCYTIQVFSIQFHFLNSCNMSINQILLWQISFATVVSYKIPKSQFTCVRKFALFLYLIKKTQTKRKYNSAEFCSQHGCSHSWWLEVFNYSGSEQTLRNVGISQSHIRSFPLLENVKPTFSAPLLLERAKAWSELRHRYWEIFSCSNPRRRQGH